MTFFNEEKTVEQLVLNTLIDKVDQWLGTIDGFPDACSTPFEEYSHEI